MTLWGVTTTLLMDIPLRVVATVKRNKRGLARTSCYREVILLTGLGSQAVPLGRWMRIHSLFPPKTVCAW